MKRSIAHANQMIQAPRRKKRQNGTLMMCWAANAQSPSSSMSNCSEVTYHAKQLDARVRWEGGSTSSPTTALHCLTSASVGKCDMMD